MEGLIPMIIQLVSGGAGGLGAGKLMPKASLGTIGNVIAGVVGGGVGGQLLAMFGIDFSGAGGTDMSGILASLAGGGVGGGALMAIVGVIKNAIGGKGDAA